LTVSEAFDYLFKLVSRRRTSMNWAGSNEADIQAPQPQAGEQARVPQSHEDGGRPQGPQPSETAGSGPDRGEGRRQVVGESAERVERLPRGARIRLGSEIRDLLERGKRKRTANLDVYFAASPASRSRLGLIVPKHGQNIVERNRLKRRLREIGRRQVLPILDGSGVRADVLIRARGAAYRADFERLAREVKEAVEGLCSADS
jgi:ribonuclease P protein component